MSASKDVQFTLKVMINRDKTKVLFAEADSDFFDVLLSFLTLPLGRITKIIAEHYGDDKPRVGSLTSLYNGLADLDVAHFHTETGKQMLLNPRSVFDKECQADSDFFDVLLSFLTLPLGKIAKIIAEHYGDDKPRVGSLTSLYNGLVNLDVVHFHTETGKQMLLNPRSVFFKECRQMKLNLSDSEPTKYFTCDWPVSGKHNITMYYDTVRCDCGKIMSREAKIISSETAEDGDDGAFCTKGASFIISDDMRMALAGSFFGALAELGIRDIKGAEMRNMTFGHNEIVDLLKGMLVSRTPLTDIIIGKGKRNFDFMKFKPGVFLPKTEKAAASNSDKMMILKVIIQKSTQKLLFALAEDDFAEFLFSLLTIPLGGAMSLIGSSTCPTSLYNLYTSVQNINDDKYLIKDTKVKLRETKLPIGYMSPNQLIPLTEEGSSEIRFESGCQVTYYSGHWVPNTFAEVHEKYVKGLNMYMVTDDLTVTPLSSTSGFSVINSLKIPLSEVKELELVVGLEEALSILKASLTSSCALTDGLIAPFLRKQPKQEG
ncbi:Unknown protein [Striga hermonthica]|uniref:DUF674 family protein n=1 Tax=Striga hermonthica TaxID=68872 RepID=A0A9N7R1I2_STRHE|nr:Unknown protein [Striga hermonthica]